MFVERMEVLEYRQTSEVELGTFPDFTYTETSKKLVFGSTCVCVYAYAINFVSGYLRNKLTDLKKNFGVCCYWPRIVNLLL